MRRASVLLAVAIALSFVPSVVAGQWHHITATTDFTIEISEPVVFTAETVLCDPEPVGWCEGLVDSHLWLYAADGNLLAANDDSQGIYGWTLASRISLELAPGTYRLRAGRCCGNPDAELPVGSRGYHLATSVDVLGGSPSPSPVEPSIEPSPIPTPTPTEEPSPSPTPTEEPSPSFTLPPSEEPSPSPSPEPTPTEVPSPTPSVEPPPPPSLEPSPRPSPSPSPSPTPSVPVEPSPSPVEPSPSVVPPTDTPSEPSPSPEVSVEEVVGEAAAAVAEAVGAAAEAVAQVAGEAIAAVGKTAERFTKLGADLTPQQREELAIPVVAGVIVSSVGGAVASTNGALNRRSPK